MDCDKTAVFEFVNRIDFVICVVTDTDWAIVLLSIGVCVTVILGL